MEHVEFKNLHMKEIGVKTFKQYVMLGCIYALAVGFVLSTQ